VAINPNHAILHPNFKRHHNKYCIQTPINLHQTQIDCLRWVNAIPDDDGLYPHDIKLFMEHANICDITEIIDIADTPYTNLYDLVNNGLNEKDFFNRIAL
jgi:hypothetical protein